MMVIFFGQRRNPPCGNPPLERTSERVQGPDGSLQQEGSSPDGVSRGQRVKIINAPR